VETVWQPANTNRAVAAKVTVRTGFIGFMVRWFDFDG
jgi:hypothetical protein